MNYVNAFEMNSVDRIKVYDVYGKQFYDSTWCENYMFGFDENGNFVDVKELDILDRIDNRFDNPELGITFGRIGVGSLG